MWCPRMASLWTLWGWASVTQVGQEQHPSAHCAGVCTVRTITLHECRCSNNCERSGTLFIGLNHAGGMKGADIIAFTRDLPGDDGTPDMGWRARYLLEHASKWLECSVRSSWAAYQRHQAWGGWVCSMGHRLGACASARHLASLPASSCHCLPHIMTFQGLLQCCV